MFCNKPPWWLDHGVYLIFNCFFLGPLYRVIYWSTVKVVKLHFRKTFNTEEEDTSIPTGNFYKNYVENFDLDAEQGERIEKIDNEQGEQSVKKDDDKV